MNAGLPGTGLGGLFYVVLAFWMPVAELPRTLRGQSSWERWRRIGVQVALASGIVAAVAGTAAAYAAVADTGQRFGTPGPTLLVTPVAVAAVLLSVLVVALRTWASWERRRAQA